MKTPIDGSTTSIKQIKAFAHKYPSILGLFFVLLAEINLMASENERFLDL